MSKLNVCISAGAVCVCHWWKWTGRKGSGLPAFTIGVFRLFLYWHEHIKVWQIVIQSLTMPPQIFPVDYTYFRHMLLFILRTPVVSATYYNTGCQHETFYIWITTNERKSFVVWRVLTVDVLRMWLRNIELLKRRHEKRVVFVLCVWEKDEVVQACSSLSTWVSEPSWRVTLLVYWLYVCEKRYLPCIVVESGRTHHWDPPWRASPSPTNHVQLSCRENIKMIVIVLHYLFTFCLKDIK